MRANPTENCRHRSTQHFKLDALIGDAPEAKVLKGLLTRSSGVNQCLSLGKSVKAIERSSEVAETAL